MLAPPFLDTAYYLTSNSGESDYLNASRIFPKQCILGFISSRNLNGMIALHQHSFKNKYYYTSNQEESDTLQSLGQLRHDLILGYLNSELTNEATDPLYSHVKDQFSHFWTSSLDESIACDARGFYKFASVLGYMSSRMTDVYDLPLYRHFQSWESEEARSLRIADAQKRLSNKFFQEDLEEQRMRLISYRNKHSNDLSSEIAWDECMRLEEDVELSPKH